MVGGWVPDGGTVSREGDAEGLDPGEVAGAVGWADADEAGVDVEVGVGDECEVVVGLAVEVEHYAVVAVIRACATISDIASKFDRNPTYNS